MSGGADIVKGHGIVAKELRKLDLLSKVIWQQPLVLVFPKLQSFTATKIVQDAQVEWNADREAWGHRVKNATMKAKLSSDCLHSEKVREPTFQLWNGGIASKSLSPPATLRGP